MNYRIQDDPDPLRESTGAAAELARAVRISLCGLDLKRAASFLPESSATAAFDWQSWLRGSFLGSLGDAFVEIYRAAGVMQVRELMAVDAELDDARSREAGGALLGRLEEAQKLRVVGRMRTMLGAGEGPHFATAFAVQCAEFHLPLRAALVSYLYGEWRCGLAAIGERGDLDKFAATGGQVLIGVVGEVLSRGAGPFEHVAGL